MSRKNGSKDETKSGTPNVENKGDGSIHSCSGWVILRKGAFKKENRSCSPGA